MPYVEVHVDAAEVLPELEEKDLEAELRRRDNLRVDVSMDALLRKVYEEFRIRGDAPECLRDYIYRRIGRVL